MLVISCSVNVIHHIIVHNVSFLECHFCTILPGYLPLHLSQSNSFSSSLRCPLNSGRNYYFLVLPQLLVHISITVFITIHWKLFTYICSIIDWKFLEDRDSLVTRDLVYNKYPVHVWSINVEQITVSLNESKSYKEDRIWAVSSMAWLFSDPSF